MRMKGLCFGVGVVYGVGLGEVKIHHIESMVVGQESWTIELPVVMYELM